jgi:hypothetical protein
LSSPPWSVSVAPSWIREVVAMMAVAPTTTFTSVKRVVWSASRANPTKPTWVAITTGRFWKEPPARRRRELTRSLASYVVFLSSIMTGSDTNGRRGIRTNSVSLPSSHYSRRQKKTNTGSPSRARRVLILESSSSRRLMQGGTLRL